MTMERERDVLIKEIEAWDSFANPYQVADFVISKTKQLRSENARLKVMIEEAEMDKNYVMDGFKELEKKINSAEKELNSIEYSPLAEISLRRAYAQIDKALTALKG